MAVTASSILLSLTGTSLALIGGQEPPAPAVSPLIPVITAPRPADPVVEVRAVSAVDLFDGVHTANGASVQVRVEGLRSAAQCWQAESLAFARDTLQDKGVHLVVNTNARPPNGRQTAQVLLPDGQDFALIALTAGAALAETAETDTELLAAEGDARANRRGLWSNACAPSQTGTSTSESTTTTTTTTATTATTTTSRVPRPSRTTTTRTSVPGESSAATTTTFPSDDVQEGVKAGRLCSPEGAAGITDSGREVTCQRTLLGNLRWMVL